MEFPAKFALVLGLGRDAPARNVNTHAGGKAQHTLWLAQVTSGHPASISNTTASGA